MKFDEFSHYRNLPDYSSGKAGNRERGAALILALLVLSVVTSTAVFMAQNFELNLRRVESGFISTQSQEYLRSTESIAVRVLVQDNATTTSANTKVDHYGEFWAKKPTPFKVPGGWVMASLDDAQAKFNINNLRTKPSPNNRATGDAKRFSTAQKRFIRLLQTFEEIELSQQEAIEITEALIDWLDADDKPTGFGGAESNFYSDKGYRPANRPMESTSELRLVRYIGAELYNLLLEHCIALPDETDININTASTELLRTLNHANDLQPLSAIEAAQLTDSRSSESFDSVSAFLNHPVMTDLMASADVNADGLNVGSQYFLLSSKVSLNHQIRESRSLVKRTDNGTRIIRRSRGVL